MVKEVRVSNGILYVCERCGLRYREKEWADKCEDFCTRYNACSIEITKHAIKDLDIMKT